MLSLIANVQTSSSLCPRQVAWRRVDAEDKHFLTVGTFTWARGNNVMIEYPQEPGYISHWNLLIKHVTKEHAGVYECQVSSKLRHLRHHVLLEVHGQSDTVCGWLARLLRLVARVCD